METGVIDLQTTPADLLLRSTLSSERLGEAIATGDHNGDGIDDIIVSAPRATTPAGAEAGRVLVFNGTPGDSDHDGRLSDQDNCPGIFNPDQADLDGDNLGNVCDPDSDGDGIAEAADCSTGNAALWSAPSDVADLRFEADAQTLRWSPPGDAGGSSPVAYDVLLSDRPYMFPSAVCIEADDSLDEQAVTTWMPAAGKIHYYLVRAENLCGGRSGADSAGDERVGRKCP